LLSVPRLAGREAVVDVDLELIGDGPQGGHPTVYAPHAAGIGAP
jgi:hypothetical protein